jgi:hypothetical protein
MIARVAGERIAPPTPWSARAATSVPAVGAIAHISEAPEKRRVPA